MVGCEYSETCRMRLKFLWGKPILSERFRGGYCFTSIYGDSCPHYQVLKKVERLEQQLQETKIVEVVES